MQFEVVLVSQFLSLHFQGMTTLTQEYLNAKGQAMMLIRLSHQCLESLQKYRNKNGHTINVNYNVLNQGEATLNTHIQSNIIQKNEG
jgi:hypothetical protein